MEDNWLKDPWELHSIDGWLYGRGTTDNKGALWARSAGQGRRHASAGQHAGRCMT